MKGLPKTKRNQLLFVRLATAVALGLLWLLLISPLRVARAAKQAQLAEIERKIAHAHRLLQQADALQAELAASRHQLEQIEAAMAPADKFTWLNSLLNRFRLPYHVEIAEFGQPLEAEVQMLPKFPYNAATFTIRGTGFFHDLGKFFADLQNRFPYLLLHNLDLEPTTSTIPEDQEKLTFKVDIVTLLRPPPP
jgi:Tfp pilus assembly protein PilO